MSQQSKIDLQGDAGRLLRYAIGLGGSVHFLGPRPKLAAQWLKRRGFVTISSGKVFVTEAGREYYAGLCENPSVTDSPLAFKDEALTGIKPDGSQSRIGARATKDDKGEPPAALPTCKTPHTTRTPEDALNDSQQLIAKQKRIASEIGISVEQLVESAKDGRIKMCGDHWGEFDKSKRNKDGSGLQNKCRKCKKEKRK